MITRKVDASSLISAAIQSHSTLWQGARESEKYIVDCDPPFDDVALKEKANWSSNFNFGIGLSELKYVTKANVSEINKAISLIEIIFEKFDKSKHNKEELSFLQFPEIREMVAERIEYAIAEFIESDNLFTTFISQSEFMNFMFGYAACIDDNSSYLPKVLHFTKVAFEDHTHVNDINRFVVFDVMKGDYFLKIYQSIKDAPDDNILAKEDDSSVCDNGWNKKAVLELLCNIFTDNNEATTLLNERKNIFDDPEKPVKVRFQTWEDLDILINHKGTIWFTANVNNIYLAKIYEQDNNRLVENYVSMGQNITTSDSLSSAQITDILYHKIHTNKTISDVLTLVLDFSINGSEFIHDIRGASKILANYALRYDIKRNNTEDKLLLAGSMWFVDTNNSILNRAVDLTVAGGVVMVGQNMEPVAFQQKIDVNPNLASLAQEKEEQKDIFKNHKPNIALSNRPTKDEVQFVNTEASGQRSSDIPFKLKSYSKIIKNSIRKIAKEDSYLSTNLKEVSNKLVNTIISEFDELELTIPMVKNVLGAIKDIRLSPVLSDREALSQAIGVASTANARKRLTRMWLMTFGFTLNNVRSIMDVQEYGRDAETVAFENNVFNDSQEVAFGISQDHILHLNGHFYKIDARFQGIQAGEDPVRAFNFVRNALLNTKLHLDAVNQNFFYKSQYKEFAKIQRFLEAKLKDLGVKLDEAKNQAAKEQQQGQGNGQPQLSPEIQEKFYQDRIKLMNKIETANLRTKHAQELKTQGQQFNQQLRLEDAKFAKGLKEMKVKTEVDATLAKAAAEMSTK